MPRLPCKANIVVSTNFMLAFRDVNFQLWIKLIFIPQLGKSALHIAAENGHLEIVDRLLSNKAFINSKTKTGITALHLASMKGWTDIVTLLVEKYSANVDSLTIVKIYLYQLFGLLLIPILLILQ